MPTYGSAEIANALSVTLLSGEDLSVPEIDLNGSDFTIPGDGNSDAYKPAKQLEITDLTTSVVNGSGAFDKLMDAIKAHLQHEFSAGRITGAEYTKAYIALVQGAMQNAVQFLLGRDAAFWQAATAQANFISAKVALANAKVQYAALRFDALAKRATYALTKLKLATEDMQYGVLSYQVTYTMPAQLLMIKEQTEAQRAQTLDSRSDGVTVAGVMGMQTALYSQQITSYKRDSEIKAAKVLFDAWATRYAVAEPEDSPIALEIKNMDGVIKKVQENNNLPYTETTSG